MKRSNLQLELSDPYRSLRAKFSATFSAVELASFLEMGWVSVGDVLEFCSREILDYQVNDVDRPPLQARLRGWASDMALTRTAHRLLTMSQEVVEEDASRRTWQRVYRAIGRFCGAGLITGKASVSAYFFTEQKIARGLFAIYRDAPRFDRGGRGMKVDFEGCVFLPYAHVDPKGTDFSEAPFDLPERLRREDLLASLLAIGFERHMCTRPGGAETLVYLRLRSQGLRHLTKVGFSERMVGDIDLDKVVGTVSS